MSPTQYICSTAALAQGRSAGRNGRRCDLRADVLPPGIEWKLLDALTGGDDLDSCDSPGLPAQNPAPAATDLHNELAALGEWFADGNDGPQPLRISCARWPEDRPFALLLSHDIDQIQDREFWRVLADLNHIRRVWQHSEHGNTRLACKRLQRALFNPKPAARDYDTILDIEARHGFRSTFFVLHDRYWARHGARFSIHDPAMHTIAARIKESGCELAVHGGYYRFNNAALYRQSREAIGRAFGVEPVGIRNHLLRYSYPDTWRAQAEAGFEYDATYGYNCRLGPRSGLALPFFAYDIQRSEQLDLLVLPLTVMDATVYRYLQFQGDKAQDFIWAQVERYAKHGGLVTLLWHGNFFNEPEYADWQRAYEELLVRLAPLRPYCATGAEINRWWRRRASLRLCRPVKQDGRWLAAFEAGAQIENLVLNLQTQGPLERIELDLSGATIEKGRESARIRLPRLQTGTRASISVQFSAARV